MLINHFSKSFLAVCITSTLASPVYSYVYDKYDPNRITKGEIIIDGPYGFNNKGMIEGYVLANNKYSGRFYNEGMVISGAKDTISIANEGNSKFESYGLVKTQGNLASYSIPLISSEKVMYLYNGGVVEASSFINGSFLTTSPSVPSEVPPTVDKTFYSVNNFGTARLTDRFAKNNNSTNKAVNYGVIVAQNDSVGLDLTNRGIIKIGNNAPIIEENAEVDYHTSTYKNNFHVYYSINGTKNPDGTKSLDVYLSKVSTPDGGAEIGSLILNGDKIFVESPFNSGYIIANGAFDFSKTAADANYDLKLSGVVYNGSSFGTNTIKVAGKGGNITFEEGYINSDFILESLNNNMTNNVNLFSTSINANLDGGKDASKGVVSNLTLGEGSIVFNELKNFDTLTIKPQSPESQSAVLLHENARLQGVSNIKLEGNDMIVVANMTPKDGADGYIASLYNNQGVISTSGGTLIIDAFPVTDTSSGQAQATEGTVITFGSTTLDKSLWKEDSSGNPQGTLKDNVKAYHDLVNVNYDKLDFDPKGTNKVVVSLAKDLPIIAPPTEDDTGSSGGNDSNNGGNNSNNGGVSPKPPVDNLPKDYNEYNEIYKATIDAGKAQDWRNTSDLEQVYWTIEQIYSANPYGYAMRASQNSLKLFADTISYSSLMARQGQNLFNVQAIYTGDITDNYASGKGHYAERNLKTSSNTVGVVVSNEYGLSDTQSIGIALGYSNQKVKFKDLSNIKNNNIFTGVFVKNRFNNVETKFGLNYQFTHASVDHNIVNTQDSFQNQASFNNNAVNAYLEGKYIFNITNEFAIAPVASLDYYYISQGKVNEGEGRFATKVDASNLNLFDIEAGLDFAFKQYVLNGSLKQILHVGVLGSLGENNKTLYGSFTGLRNRYRFKAVPIPKVAGKLGYKLEFETINRFIYSLGANYEIGKDNQNFDANLGVGYKF